MILIPLFFQSSASVTASGKVVKGGDQPFPDVSVSASDGLNVFSGVSDQDGVFQVDVPAGQIQYKLSAGGFGIDMSTSETDLGVLKLWPQNNMIVRVSGDLGQNQMAVALAVSKPAHLGAIVHRGSGKFLLQMSTAGFPIQQGTIYFFCKGGELADFQQGIAFFELNNYKVIRDYQKKLECPQEESQPVQYYANLLKQIEKRGGVQKSGVKAVNQGSLVKVAEQLKLGVQQNNTVQTLDQASETAKQKLKNQGILQNSPNIATPTKFQNTMSPQQLDTSGLPLIQKNKNPQDSSTNPIPQQHKPAGLLTQPTKRPQQPILLPTKPIKPPKKPAQSSKISQQPKSIVLPTQLSKKPSTQQTSAPSPKPQSSQQPPTQLTIPEPKPLQPQQPKPQSSKRPPAQPTLPPSKPLQPQQPKPQSSKRPPAQPTLPPSKPLQPQQPKPQSSQQPPVQLTKSKPSQQPSTKPTTPAPKPLQPQQQSSQQPHTQATTTKPQQQKSKFSTQPTLESSTQPAKPSVLPTSTLPTSTPSQTPTKPTILTLPAQKPIAKPVKPSILPTQTTRQPTQPISTPAPNSYQSKPTKTTQPVIKHSTQPTKPPFQLSKQLITTPAPKTQQPKITISAQCNLKPSTQPIKPSILPTQPSKQPTTTPASKPQQLTQQSRTQPKTNVIPTQPTQPTKPTTQLSTSTSSDQKNPQIQKANPKNPQPVQSQITLVSQHLQNQNKQKENTQDKHDNFSCNPLLMKCQSVILYMNGQPLYYRPAFSQGQPSTNNDGLFKLRQLAGDLVLNTTDNKNFELTLVTARSWQATLNHGMFGHSENVYRLSRRYHVRRRHVSCQRIRAIR